MPQPSGQDHAASGAEEDEEEEEINGTEQDEEHDEEESSDGESVTRCLCGEQRKGGAHQASGGNFIHDPKRDRNSVISMRAPDSLHTHRRLTVSVSYCLFM